MLDYRFYLDFLNRFIMANKIIAPRIATNKAGKLKDIPIELPVTKDTTKPPIKDPITPTTMLAISPID